MPAPRPITCLIAAVLVFLLAKNPLQADQENSRPHHLIARPATAEWQRLADPFAGYRGLWITRKQDVVVAVDACPVNGSDSQPSLCGTIRWFADDVPPAGPSGAKLCGYPVLSGLGPADNPDNPAYPIQWQDGKLYKIDDDRTYDADLILHPDDKLELRAYLGIRLLGKSKFLTRIDAGNTAKYPTCTAD